MEKYLTLSLGNHVVLKDSLQFLAGSLDYLASCLLRSGRDRFLELHKGFPTATEEQLDLALRKGVYPYDHMNDWSKFKHALPAREAFYSKLRSE